MIKRLSILVALALSFPACQNQAGPPAPPAEMPLQVAFPSSLSINMDSLVDSGGEYSDEIVAGAEMVRETEEVVEEDLGFLSQLTIPSNTETVRFTGEAELDGATNTIRIDFSDFALDGDGAAEGCSGHTGALPICFRIWFDDERVMAGRFDTLDADGRGVVGRFRVAETGDATGFSGHVIFDHEDAENKSTENFTLDQTLVLAVDGDPQQFDRFHSVAIQVGPEATARKTLHVADQGRGTLFDFPVEEGLTVYDYRFASGFLEGTDYWLGSLDDTIDDEAFDGLCAHISTGEEATSLAECDVLGMSADDLSFIGFTSDLDVAFPNTSVFPDDPGF